MRNAFGNLRDILRQAGKPTICGSGRLKTNKVLVVSGPYRPYILLHYLRHLIPKIPTRIQQKEIACIDGRASFVLAPRSPVDQVGGTDLRESACRRIELQSKTLQRTWHETHRAEGLKTRPRSPTTRSWAATCRSAFDLSRCLSLSASLHKKRPSPRGHHGSIYLLKKSSGSLRGGSI